MSVSINLLNTVCYYIALLDILDIDLETEQNQKTPHQIEQQQQQLQHRQSEPILNKIENIHYFKVREPLLLKKGLY